MDMQERADAGDGATTAFSRVPFEVVAFDVDGTLVAPASGNTFRARAEDWTWLPGRLHTLRLIVRLGIPIGACTNQGGVAIGKLAAADLEREWARMQKHLGVPFPVRMCTYLPGVSPEDPREAFRRKPEPGMLFELAALHGIRLQDYGPADRRMLFVGDRPEDELAARAAGCSFMRADDFFGPRPGQNTPAAP